MRTKTLLYQGLLRSPASWARVGRGYLGALVELRDELGVDVTATHVRGFGYDPDFPAPAGVPLIEPRAVDTEPDIGLGFLHPPLLDRLRGGTRGNLFVWEGTHLPEGWGNALRNGTDLVVVPSRFVAEAVAKSGVPESQIRVVPYGHDLSCPPQKRELRRGAGDHPFTIVSIGAPHWRKGHGELLRAYRQAFSADDAVRLRIKTTYDPGDRRRRQHFELPVWEELLRSCGLREPDAPAVEIIATIVRDDEVGSFLDDADLYAAPSWGEAFGLAILDAAARGIPVVTTAWSGPAEFLPAGPDLVPFDIVEDPRGSYEAAPGNEVARPDVDAIATRLRWHFQHPEESVAAGGRGQRGVIDRTWGAAARELVAALEL